MYFNSFETFKTGSERALRNIKVEFFSDLALFFCFEIHVRKRIQVFIFSILGYMVVNNILDLDQSVFVRY